MYGHPKRKLLADMDKTMLLKMREEQDMTNKEIAEAIGCSDVTIRKLIGPMPPDMLKRKRSEIGSRNVAIRYKKTTEGGYTVERKMQSFKPQPKEEPKKAVLAVKRSDIHLSGSYMHYVVAADGHCIDVETEEGRVLMNVPKENLETFIKELTAIHKNIDTAAPMAFWG